MGLVIFGFIITRTVLANPVGLIVYIYLYVVVLFTTRVYAALLVAARRSGVSSSARAH